MGEEAVDPALADELGPLVIALHKDQLGAVQVALGSEAHPVLRAEVEPADGCLRCYSRCAPKNSREEHCGLMIVCGRRCSVDVQRVSQHGLCSLRRDATSVHPLPTRATPTYLLMLAPPSPSDQGDHGKAIVVQTCRSATLYKGTFRNVAALRHPLWKSRSGISGAYAYRTPSGAYPTR